MDWNLIHIVKESSLNIVFVGNSLTMIAVSDTIVHAIEALKAGKNKEYIYTQYGLEIKNSIEKIEKESANKVKSKLKIKERKIKRITLHVTNGCNLQCKYCYADGGHYNTTLGRMTKKVADNFISFCIKNFDSIDIIMFFGGEPFLNLKIMDYICKEFTCKYKNNEMNYIPAFGVVTNGTILNDNIISFIDKYISIITVSVDGLDNINDINRVFKDGTGSFSKIEKFIESVKVKTKAILYFEATYTKEHIKNEYSYSHIKSDLQNKFGINGVVVNEDSINRDCIESFILIVMI